MSRDTLRKLIRDGEIRAMKLGPAKQAHWKIPEDAIDEYIRRRITETAAS